MNDEAGYCANPACCLLPMLCAVTHNPPYVDMSGVVSRLKVKLYEVEKKNPLLKSFVYFIGTNFMLTPQSLSANAASCLASRNMYQFLFHLLVYLTELSNLIFPYDSICC